LKKRRPRHKQEDNIRMELGEIGWGGVDWIDLAQDRDQWKAAVNTAMNLNCPLNLGTSGLAAVRMAASQGLGSMELVSYKIEAHIETITVLKNAM
jgi:hypothetical protein